ncbi:MAG: GNAT family N-acetyltransferase [Acidimicrobiales bacterium]
MHLRPATPDEATELSELALRSKAVWGYDDAFLEACRAELTLDAARLDELRIVVAEADGEVVGFYSLIGVPPDGELGHLFVEPEWIGRGLGRALWTHMSTTAAALSFARVRIESDPGASSFYESMGARRVGRVPSGSVEGRWLPLLEYDVPRDPRS